MRTSQNAVKAKFAELTFPDVGWIEGFAPNPLDH
jgi:hypothetical protein